MIPLVLTSQPDRHYYSVMLMRVPSRLMAMLDVSRDIIRREDCDVMGVCIVLYVLYSLPPVMAGPSVDVIVGPYILDLWLYLVLLRASMTPLSV